MASIEVMLSFLAATVLFAFMPGPAMLYATAQTIARGRKAGWMAALGLHTGGYVHVIAAALGLAVLFTTVPVLYTALKLVGGGGGELPDLVGHQNVSHRCDPHGPARQNAGEISPQSFWESATVEILNPKTAMFYLAFLPQFADPMASMAIWAQLLILGTIVNVVFSSAYVLCVLLADRMTGFLKQSPATTRITRQLGGGILVGLGLNLAFNK